MNTVCQATHVLHTVNYERTDFFIEMSMPILFFAWPTKTYIQQGFLIKFSHL